MEIKLVLEFGNAAGHQYEISKVFTPLFPLT